MKKEFLNKLKKHWIIIWLCAACLALGIFVVSAAYTRVSSVKRVISTRKGVGMLFSSNYLQSGNTLLKNITFSSSDSDPVVVVTICNYSQSDKTRHNEKDITYTLTAELVDSSGIPISSEALGNKNYSIALGNDKRLFTADALKFDFTNQELLSDSSNSHSYQITFDRSQFENQDIYVKLTAKPDGSMKDELSDISGIIGISLYTKKTASWSGQFTDTQEPSKLDGFNYTISGSGNGTVTISWNSEYVEISPWFLESLNKTSSGNSVTFSVDSSIRNMYALQFYRKKTPQNGEKWADRQKTNITADGNSYITFSFIPSEETQ